MEELKRIGRVLGKAGANLLSNLTNYRGWGFLFEAFLGFTLLLTFPENLHMALVLMLGVVTLLSLLETGIPQKYRKEEELYKFWYTIKGSLASCGLVWMLLQEVLPAKEIIVAMGVFDIAFAAIYGERLAAGGWKPRVPSVQNLKLPGHS